jgi:hypothetical protein
MASQAPHRRRLFTLQQANATLPLVRAIVADLVRLARDVEDRRQRLNMLRSGRKSQARDVYGEELEQMQEELEKDVEQLGEYVRELEELGVELKDPLVGLIDFRCQMDGREVYLCWKLGEPAIQYWHELDSGFAGRQPLGESGPAGLSKSELN